MDANSAVVSSQFANAIDEGVAERSDIGKLQFSARGRGKVVTLSLAILSAAGRFGR
jgi:hypothetical protein